MESAIQKTIQEFDTTDEATRRKLIVTLNRMAESLEESNDTIHRVGYLHLQTAIVKVSFDIGLFRYLSEVNASVSVDQIRSSTGAQDQLLRRCLSYLSSTGYVSQIDKDYYAPNKVTHNLAEKVSEAGISHCFETIGRQYQSIPSFLKKTEYQNPTNELQTVFQQAWDTDLHAFAWFASHSQELKHFNDYMAFRREPKLSWITVYPVKEATKDWAGENAVYVNVGGGIGHQCAQFKAKYPEIPGQVVLQDMPHSIEKALQTDGVQNMVHNFFDEQPVKGAKFYHTRGVLHNHPDHKVRELLLRTKAAMTADSIMLLDEMILPENHVNAYAACMDLTMMAAFAASERSESQWRAIIEEVGLKLVRTYVYNPMNYEGVMDVRLP